MPRISEFYGIVIAMFYNDHEPPHFHAIYGEFKALIEIESAQVIRGDLPGRATNLVFDWARQHREELMENWDRARQHTQLKRIAPLD
jgi:hypothetical protein